LENPGDGVIKIQKSRGKVDQTTLEIQGEGVIKRQKSRGIHKNGNSKGA
jgi:hypothetical protein